MAKKKQNLTPEELLEQALVPECEWPYSVPENWVWTKVEYLRANENGFFDGDWILSKNMDLQGKVRLIQLSDIGILEFLDKSRKYINEKTFHELGCSEILEGDILISRMADPIARSCMMPKMESTCITAVDVAVLRCNQIFVNSKYVNYLFNASWFTDAAMSVARGTTRVRITRSNLGQLPFPLPPLAEQQRIVDRIENLFEKLAKAKELIQDAIDSFENRKAAILHKAFSGELTKKWREENGIGIESWHNRKFEEVADIKSNLVNPMQFAEYPHIAPDNIEKKTGKLLPYRSINEDGVISGKHRFYPGQILYSKIRPYLSKVVLVDFEGLCSADMYPILPREESKYLWYYMLSDDFLEQASSAGSRSVLPKINKKELSKIMVRIPTIGEQNEISKILDKLFEKEDQVKFLLDTISTIDLIKKSILARAFRGELQTNNLAEESVIILLKNIYEYKNKGGE